MTDLKTGFSSSTKTEINAELYFTTKVDTECVLNFYRGNRHQHVHIRDENLLRQMVADGQFLILRDKETGELLASSGTYAYKVDGDNRQASYREIGSTRFSEKVAGFGLYPLFISSQVIHSMLTNPCKKMFIANVYDDSPVGRELLTKKTGWKIINATPDILKVFYATKDKGASKDEDSRPMTWYGSPAARMPHQARIIQDFIANKTVITHKKHDVVLNVDYSRFDLAKRFAPHLDMLSTLDERKTLCDGNGGDLNVPSLSKYLKHNAPMHVVARALSRHKPNDPKL